MLSDRDYYKIDSAKGLTFAATFLLVNMAKNGLEISTRKLGADRQLVPATDFLSEKKLITAEEREQEDTFTLSDSGRQKTDAFQQRYSNILTYIDIFGFVDLQQGSFAFEKFGTFATDQEWADYCSDDRWSDLRIAMIDYLDGDATELVFSQMTLEGHLNTEDFSWQQNLMRGRWWREIQDICDSAIQEEDLGEATMDDIYDQATTLLKQFYPDDKQLQTNLNSWYSNQPEETAPPAYGAAAPITTANKPPWQSPWTL